MLESSTDDSISKLQQSAKAETENNKVKMNRAKRMVNTLAQYKMEIKNLALINCF